MLDVIFKVLKNEGLGGLYAGLSSQYIMTSSTNFLYYFFYNYLQTAYNKWLERKAKTNTNNNNNNNNEKRENKPKAGVFATLAIGVLAGCITQFIINPLSVAITRIKGKKPPLGHNIIKTIYLIGIQFVLLFICIFVSYSLFYYLIILIVVSIFVIKIN